MGEWPHAGDWLGIGAIMASLRLISSFGCQSIIGALMTSPPHPIHKHTQKWEEKEARNSYVLTSMLITADGPEFG